MNPNKSPIYNHVGRLILAECKANKVTYKYACVNKIRACLSPAQKAKAYSSGYVKAIS